MTFPLLSCILLCPVAALAVILLLPASRAQAVRCVALAASAATLALSVLLVFRFDASSAAMQFVEDVPWVRGWGIRYTLGVDGMAVAMVLLTAIVIFCGVLCSWNVQYRVKDFFANMMFLVAGVFGVFMSTNLFFFFLFYEIAVIPMYLLIAIWGSTNKEYAAMKLTLYLLAGSALVIAAFLALYAYPGSGTFDLVALKTRLVFTPEFQRIWFPMLFFGFGVLAGCFPFHVWSPDGHVAAPTAASMLHAGVLMKLGAFGILRIGVYLLPDGAREWAPVVACLALCNILYGAMVATQQRDLKYIIGYSSVSHMGIVLLGIATLSVVGMSGAVYQMFSHGIMTALFFACVGTIYDTAHTRQLDDLGGLARKAPVISALFILAGLAGLGLPGLSGFVAEALVLIGAVEAFPIVGFLAIGGLLITAYYVLSAIQKAFYGKPATPAAAEFKDIGLWDLFPRAVLAGVLIYFGLFPGVFLHWIGASVSSLIAPGILP